MSSETEPTKKGRSGAWYLLPIFLTIIGGVIAYFVIKEDDPKKAKNCLYLGIILTAIGVGFTVVSGVMLASEMENSSFFDDKWENSNTVISPSEMEVTDKSQINSQAESMQYQYNANGLKVNYIQLQDADGNNITAVDGSSLYNIVVEIQNRDNVEKHFYYNIYSQDENGNGGGGGGDEIIAPNGTILINDGWATWMPGTYKIEVDIPDGSELYLRMLHLEEEK